MKVINIHGEEGSRCGLLVKSLRKYHYVLLIDNPLRIKKFPLEMEKFFRDELYKGKPYPISRFIRVIRRCAKSWHGGVKNLNKDVKEVLAQRD